MKISYIALAATALFSSATAIAEDGKYYFGAEVGSVKIENRAQAIANDAVAIAGGTASVTQTVRNGAGRIFGGYKFNENVDLELGYLQSQSFNTSIAGLTGGNVAYAAGGGVKVSGFDYSVLLRPSKDSGFNELFLKVGGHNFTSKANFSMSAGGNAITIPSTKTSGSGMLFGVGYDLSLDKNLSVRFGLTQYNKISGMSDADATFFSIGVKGTF